MREARRAGRRLARVATARDAGRDGREHGRVARRNLQQHVSGEVRRAGRDEQAGGARDERRAETAQTLDIYRVDVEGGGAPPVISPNGEFLLVGTGWPRP